MPRKVWDEITGVQNQVFTRNDKLPITVTSYWVRWRLKSWLFAQQFLQAQIKENIKAPCHWPLWGKFTGGWGIPEQKANNAENVSIRWCHHADNYWQVFSKRLFPVLKGNDMIKLLCGRTTFPAFRYFPYFSPSSYTWELLNIMFIFGRCRRSTAVVTPVI